MMLIDLYLLHRDGPHTISILRRILTLAEQLKVAKLDINDVREFLALRATLGRYQCDFLDVPDALRLIECLSALPQSWTWKQVQYVVNVMAVLLRENISADDMATFIVRHRQLERHGFTEVTVDAVLKALKEAGAVGRRRATVIARLVDLAHQQVHVEDLECAREQKEAQVQTLAQTIREAERRLASLQQETAKVTPHLQRLNDEYREKSSHLEVLGGVKNFLLGRLSADDPLWERLEHTLRMGRRGELSNEQTQQIMTTHIVTKFAEFVAQVTAEARGGQRG
jgi:hypothetical protein